MPMDGFSRPRLLIVSDRGEGEQATTASETTVHGAESTDRPYKARSPPEHLKDQVDEIEAEMDGDIVNSVHLRGGARNHYTSHRTTTVATARRGHRGSAGSRSSSGTYVSYSSGGSEKRYKKPYSQDPRFRIWCCACM